VVALEVLEQGERTKQACASTVSHISVCAWFDPTRPALTALLAYSTQ
jgi:hypothetical protein